MRVCVCVCVCVGSVWLCVRGSKCVVVNERASVCGCACVNVHV